MVFAVPGPRLLRWLGFDITDRHIYGIETVEFDEGVEQYYACLR